MKITERQAKLLLQFRSGDGAAFVAEYLACLLYDTRENQDNAKGTDDMLRCQGQVRLLKRILKDIDSSPEVIARFESNRSNR